jgi:ferrochelatase
MTDVGSAVSAGGGIDEETWGVLLMAYGTPGSLDDVEAYYTHIRRGRAPSPEQLAALIGRYEAVGGVTPLREITFEQARKVEARLRAAGMPARVFVGMKHWHPYVAEAVREMGAAGVRQAVGLVLAPHYSRMSAGQYIEYAEKEREQSCPELSLRYVERWGANPVYTAELGRRVAAALGEWEPETAEVVFTAHSLPVRIRSWGDPYERELAETAGLVAAASGAPHWSFAFQSASATGEPWLGPDLLERLSLIARAGERRNVLVCPIGFVADHLEVLYDLDIEAATRCRELGLGFRRTPMLNADAPLVEAVSREILAVSRAK